MRKGLTFQLAPFDLTRFSWVSINDPCACRWPNAFSAMKPLLVLAGRLQVGIALVF